MGDNKILDRDHTQLRPRAPDPSGRPITFEFTAGDVDSDDEGEDDDFTAERILADKPDPGTPVGRLYKVRWCQFEGIRRIQGFVGASEQLCAEVHHGLDGVSEEREHFFGCQGRVGPFGGCCSTIMGPPWHFCLFLCLGDG